MKKLIKKMENNMIILLFENLDRALEYTGVEKVDQIGRKFTSEDGSTVYLLYRYERFAHRISLYRDKEKDDFELIVSMEKSILESIKIDSGGENFRRIINFLGRMFWDIHDFILFHILEKGGKIEEIELYKKQELNQELIKSIVEFSSHFIDNESFYSGYRSTGRSGFLSTVEDAEMEGRHLEENQIAIFYEDSDNEDLLSIQYYLDHETDANFMIKVNNKSKLFHINERELKEFKSDILERKGVIERTSQLIEELIRLLIIPKPYQFQKFLEDELVKYNHILRIDDLKKVLAGTGIKSLILSPIKSETILEGGVNRKGVYKNSIVIGDIKISFNERGRIFLKSKSFGDENSLNFYDMDIMDMYKIAYLLYRIML